MFDSLRDLLICGFWIFFRFEISNSVNTERAKESLDRNLQRINVLELAKCADVLLHLAAPVHAF